nr:hypothetical protein Iba_chr06fCG8660 [Ipomoea batatas]
MLPPLAPKGTNVYSGEVGSLFRALNGTTVSCGRERSRPTEVSTKRRGGGSVDQTKTTRSPTAERGCEHNPSCRAERARSGNPPPRRTAHDAVYDAPSALSTRAARHSSPDLEKSSPNGSTKAGPTETQTACGAHYYYHIVTTPRVATMLMLIVRNPRIYGQAHRGSTTSNLPHRSPVRTTSCHLNPECRKKLVMLAENRSSEQRTGLG